MLDDANALGATLTAAIKHFEILKLTHVSLRRDFIESVRDFRQIRATFDRRRRKLYGCARIVTLKNISSSRWRWRLRAAILRSFGNALSDGKARAWHLQEYPSFSNEYVEKHTRREDRSEKCLVCTRLRFLSVRRREVCIIRCVRAVINLGDEFVKLVQTFHLCYLAT